jgi:hypothetical protein
MNNYPTNCERIILSNIIYIKEALEIFKQDPRVQAIIKSKVNPKIADDLGHSIEILEQQVLLETFRDYATSQGIDTLILALNMVATPEQKKQVLLQHHQDIANALGIGLEEYFVLNPRLKAEIE